MTIFGDPMILVDELPVDADAGTWAEAPASAERTHPLADHTDAFVTTVGAAFPGERAVFRGRDVHQEVMHDRGWIQLAAEAAGCAITAEQADLLQTIWVSTSYPDARVWCNRVAAFAGSMRSTPALALAAGNAVAEAMVYGRRNEYRAISMFRRIRAALDAGASIQECLDEHAATQGYLPGYGRPLYNGDERIEPWMQAARERGLADGPHVQLAFAIEAHLLAAGKPLRMNAGALVSAFAADFGFTPQQFMLTNFPCFIAGMTPCYLEALEKPMGAVFAARVDQVDYTGVSDRSWGG